MSEALPSIFTKKKRDVKKKKTRPHVNTCRTMSDMRLKYSITNERPVYHAACKDEYRLNVSKSQLMCLEELFFQEFCRPYITCAVSSMIGKNRSRFTQFIVAIRIGIGIGTNRQDILNLSKFLPVSYRLVDTAYTQNAQFCSQMARNSLRSPNIRAIYRLRYYIGYEVSAAPKTDVSSIDKTQLI